MSLFLISDLLSVLTRYIMMKLAFDFLYFYTGRTFKSEFMGCLISFTAISLS